MTSGVPHSIPKTNRCGGWPNGWWEFLLRLPLVTPGRIALSDSESRSPCRQCGDSFSAGDRSFGPGNYWDGWRGAEVLLPDSCQRTHVNQPWRGSQSHQGSQGQQGSGPKRYPEQGPKASSPTSGIPPGPDLQCDSPHPSLPYSVEARSSDLYP